MTRVGSPFAAFTIAAGLLVTGCWSSVPGMGRRAEGMFPGTGQMPGPASGQFPNHMPGQMPGPGGMGAAASTPVVTPAPTSTPGGAASVSYQRDIQPILDRECVGCHGGTAGMFVDSYDHLMAGGDGGTVVIPGDPEGSERARRIRGSGGESMPPGDSTLSPAEIDLILTWIAEGSPNN